MVDRFVLVTSGNKGLGFETARRLKALGYIVYMGRALVPRVKGRSRGFSLTSLTKARPAVPPPRWTRARGGSISSSTMLACAATAAVETRSPFTVFDLISLHAVLGTVMPRALTTIRNAQSAVR
jgi:NAD(P)-dependent dehydrogenase (short-subunit alcohol dehydrogenase family)